MMTRKMSAENEKRSYKASDLGVVDVKKNRRKNKWGKGGGV